MSLFLAQKNLRTGHTQLIELWEREPGGALGAWLVSAEYQLRVRRLDLKYPPLQEWLEYRTDFYREVK